MASKSGKSGKKAPSGKKNAPAGDKSPAGKKNAPPPKQVRNPLPWGMISVIAGVVAAAALLVGVPIYLTSGESEGGGDSEVGEGPVPNAGVKGVTDYYEKGESWVENGDHVNGSVDYATDPPVGGEHNSAWQTCTGNAYSEPIPNEHAVHSLEHGAIWITYQPDLDEEDVEALAGKIEGTDYTMISPYEGQETPISVQTWGYQMSLEDADDERIDEFIEAYRLNATREPNAACSNGVSATGDTPADM